MKSLIVLFIMLSFGLPASAEIYAPEDWQEDGARVTEDREQVPEEISDMVDNPDFVKKPLGFPGRKSVWEAGLKALVVPSWGHFYMESYNRAWLIAGVELAIAVAIVNSDPTLYLNTSEATQDTIYQQREALSVVGGLIWIWSIFDATSLAIENNRRIDEEEKKISLEYKDDLRLVHRYSWE